MNVVRRLLTSVLRHQGLSLLETEQAELQRSELDRLRSALADLRAECDRLRPSTKDDRATSDPTSVDRATPASGPISGANAINPIFVACAGLADFEVLQPYLQRGGFRPLALLMDESTPENQERPSDSPDFKNASTAIPVLPLNDLRRLQCDIRYDHVPVVIADTGDGAAFRSLGPRVAEMLGENQLLLHPAFLAEFVDHDLSRVVFSTGFPGSGNVIVQTIMARLLAPERDGRFDQMESWSASGHILLGELLVAAFKDMGAETADVGYSHPGFVTLLAQFSSAKSEIEDWVILPLIPSQIYMAEKCYGGHWLPSLKDIQRIERHRGRLALIARHPLDIVVSYAAKFWAHERDLETRKKQTHVQLAGDSFFNRALIEQLIYLRAAVRYAATAAIFRYEDLIEDPKGQIRKIAEFLEVPVDEATVTDLCSLVGDVDIGAPAGHVFRPGASKWAKFINSDRIRQAIQSGIFEYASPFGYPKEGDASIRPISEILTQLNYHVSGHSPMFFFGAQEVRDSVARDHFLTTVNNISLTSSDRELGQRCAHYLSGDRWLKNVLGSMSFWSRTDALQP